MRVICTNKLKILICMCIFMCCCIVQYYFANNQARFVSLQNLTAYKHRPSNKNVDNEEGALHVTGLDETRNLNTNMNFSNKVSRFTEFGETLNRTTNKNIENVVDMLTGLDETRNRTTNINFSNKVSIFTGFGGSRNRTINKFDNEVSTFSGFDDTQIRTTRNTFTELTSTDIIVHKDKNSSIKHLMFWTNPSLFDDIICRSDNRLTSCKYSKVQLLNVDTSTKTIEVGIYLYDSTNKVKPNGGDIIFVWAEKLPSGGKAAGHVVDHMNGSYTGRVRVHWSGRTKVSAKLASAKENQCLRFRSMQKYGNSVFALQTPYGIHYRFSKNNLSVTEFTRCYPHSDVYGYKSVCNFTSLNFDFSWFCGKPTKPGLGCGNYNMFQMKPYNKSAIIPNQNPDEVIWIPGHCVFQQSVDVFLNDNDKIPEEMPKQLVKCSDRPKRNSWTDSRPTGYSISDNWQFNNCLYTVKYERHSLNQCLKGKTISFIGDSTLRQYLETLANIMNLTIHSSGIPYEFNKIAHSINHDHIHLTWRKHEMPFHGMQLIRQSKVQSSTYELDTIANSHSLKGSNSIVVVHYSAHLQSFSPSVYRSRIGLLVEALRRLLDKKPETTVLVKGASPIVEDTKWFDIRISLIFNEILFEEFSQLQDRVVYLDVFSIFVANNCEKTHPTGETMKQQIQQLMAYIC